MTTAIPALSFTDPASADRLERVAAALRANNFDVEILDDAAAARARVNDLIPEEHCLPLESERAMEVYGQPSALHRVLILNAEPRPGRGTVLLLREAIGF